MFARRHLIAGSVVLASALALTTGVAAAVHGSAFASSPERVAFTKANTSSRIVPSPAPATAPSLTPLTTEAPGAKALPKQKTDNRKDLYLRVIRCGDTGDCEELHDRYGVWNFGPPDQYGTDEVNYVRDDGLGKDAALLVDKRGKLRDLVVANQKGASFFVGSAYRYTYKGEPVSLAAYFQYDEANGLPIGEGRLVSAWKLDSAKQRFVKVNVTKVTVSRDGFPTSEPSRTDLYAAAANCDSTDDCTRLHDQYGIWNFGIPQSIGSHRIVFIKDDAQMKKAAVVINSSGAVQQVVVVSEVAGTDFGGDSYKYQYKGASAPIVAYVTYRANGSPTIVSAWLFDAKKGQLTEVDAKLVKATPYS